MCKSFLTNIISLAILILGLLIKNSLIINIGAFALSGGITNWLAIHMLFEKIPFIYGSGVIPNKFESFKISIKNLIIKEFFNENQISSFLSVNKSKIEDRINYDQIFEHLCDAIEESSFGSMLSMVGGRSTLEPLKEPVKIKLSSIANELIANKSPNSSLLDDIETIIDERLNELTPEMVKIILQNIIKEHLSWLVIWGSIFGGGFGIIKEIIAK